MSLENPQQNKPENTQEQREKTPEEQANYEGNHSLLMIERLQSPEVFDKLVNDLYEDRTTVDFSQYDYVDPEYIQSLKRDEYFVKQDIKLELLEAIKTTSHSTEVGFSEHGYLKSNEGETGVGYIEICNNYLGNPFNETVLSKNIAEAHEKGHTIRNYNIDSKFTKDLQSIFDFGKVSLSEQTIEDIRTISGSEDSREKIESNHKEYLSFPWEIVERMSQVKNYFGFSGNEKFTKEHLEYARDNYVKDTGHYAPQIQLFFEAIIDDERFVEKMNTLGI